MEWLEVKPIPKGCENCQEEDCYNCDIAGKRWILSKEFELLTSRKLLERKIEHLLRKIAVIDVELEKMRNS